MIELTCFDSDMVGSDDLVGHCAPLKLADLIKDGGIEAKLETTGPGKGEIHIKTQWKPSV